MQDRAGDPWEVQEVEVGSPERRFLPPPVEMGPELVIVELFGGILASTEAAFQLDLNVAQTYFAEIDEAAIAVAQIAHPGSQNLGDVCDITEAMVEELLRGHPRAIFYLPGGPPCQDVLSLNVDRLGAGVAVAACVRSMLVWSASSKQKQLLV